MNNILQKTLKLAKISCNLHTTCIRHSKVGRPMNKIMGGGGKKRKFQYNETITMPNPNVLSKGSYEGRYSVNSRRVAVLNKLFMENITELMGNGECASEILGLGIEINRVQVTPDFKLIKVFWIATGTGRDEEIEEVLTKSAFYLRHELSVLRVMGQVPHIQFVKDKRYSIMVQLDNILKEADYGEDHQPINVASELQSELQLLLSLESTVKKQIEQIEKTELEEDEELPLPEMPQNVLGLNHADIYNRLQKAVQKSQGLHREEENESSWAAFKVTQQVNEDPLVLGSHSTERRIFRQFLEKRQILRKRARRLEDKNYSPDLEYLKEQANEKELDFYDKIAFQFEQEYVEEDETKKL